MKNQLLIICIIASILPGLRVGAQDWSISEGLMNFTYEDTQGVPPAVGPIIRRWEAGLGNPFTNTEFFTIGKYDFFLDYIYRENALVINNENLFMGIGEENPKAKLHVNYSNTFGNEKPTVHIGPHSGSGFGYFTVNKPQADNSSNVARFRDNGGTVVSINEFESTYQLSVNGDIDAGNLFTVSDARYKENIDPIEDPQKIVNQLQPKSYKFKKDQKKSSLPKGLQFGLLAQEVQEILPNLVKESVVTNEEGEVTDHRLGVNYLGLIPILIAAQQESNQKINELIKQNLGLLQRLAALESR